MRATRLNLLQIGDRGAGKRDWDVRLPGQNGSGTIKNFNDA